MEFGLHKNDSVEKLLDHSILMRIVRICDCLQLNLCVFVNSCLRIRCVPSMLRYQDEI
jgi:hypothetical protein